MYKLPEVSSGQVLEGVTELACFHKWWVFCSIPLQKIK